MTTEGGRCFRTPALCRVRGRTPRSRCPIAAPTTNEHRINDRIRAREVRLVDAEGGQLGIKPLPEALSLAREQDLDLVEVAPQANPPVCRIMDYAKFKYDEAQKAKESRRKTTNVTIKEMKYRVKIGHGDFDTKTRKVLHFLEEGHKVKITIMFRGRETSHPHLGKKILDDIADMAVDLAKVEAAPKLDGRNMIMVLAPDKRAQAAAQAAAKKAAEDGADAPAEGAAATTNGTAAAPPADAPVTAATEAAPAATQES